MESLEYRIAKFLAVEEPEADGSRPVTPGNGTLTGEGGNMGRDVKAADIVYDGCGMPDGSGFGYAEYLDEGRCYLAHLPFGRIKRFGGRTVHYTPPVPVEFDYASYVYFTCDVFSDRVSMKDCCIGRVPVIIDSLEDNVAKGCVLLDDLTTKPCFIARVGDSFALGKDPGSALDLATRRHQAAISPEPEPICTDDDELPF
jgi:hypothetical protein